MKTTLHYYRFNIENESERIAYNKLRAELKHTPGRGHCMNCHGESSDHWNTATNRQHKHGTSETVELETACLFENQWNTATNRIFDWYQGVYPNAHIKQGHYLDITPAMIEIRDNTHKCGYCGNFEPAQKGYVFCPACLGSEYLKEENIHLLRMKPVSTPFKKNRAQLTHAEQNHLMPLYIEAQTKAGHSRNNKRIADKRARLEKDYHAALENAETEYHGMTWLLDNDINVDNCIYYKHAGKFSFGWRNPVSEGVKASLHTALNGFPYHYEIKGVSKAA